MKRSFNRSKSYTEQGYAPVATEESEGEEVFTSDNPSIKRPRPRRSVSDSGADKAKQSHSFDPIDIPRQDTEYNMSTAQSESEEFIQNEMNRQDNQDGPSIRRQKGKKKIILVIGLFAASLVLHLYSLVDFLQENNHDIMNSNSPSKTSKLNGSEIKTKDTTFSDTTRCLLTIHYEEYIKEVDEHRDCRPTNKTTHSVDYISCGEEILPKLCLCTKQIHNPEKRCGGNSLKNYNCSLCKGIFPKCLHGGTQNECGEKCFLEKYGTCGTCDCTLTDYTGNFCHLPKKLECVRCLTNDCDSLPPCNNRTEYPCQDSFNSTIMKCTTQGKQENENAKDCSLVLNETKETTDDGNPVNDKYTSSNTTNYVQDTCSWASKIGFFVLDWIVFVAVFFLISYIICREICGTRQCQLTMLEEKGTIYNIYFVSVSLLVVIPPVVNCVTCCSTTCDVIGKALPFVKAGFLVVLLFLLHVILKKRDKSEINIKMKDFPSGGNAGTNI